MHFLFKIKKKIIFMTDLGEEEKQGCYYRSTIESTAGISRQTVVNMRTGNAHFLHWGPANWTGEGKLTYSSGLKGLPY